MSDLGLAYEPVLHLREADAELVRPIWPEPSHHGYPGLSSIHTTKEQIIVELFLNSFSVAGMLIVLQAGHMVRRRTSALKAT